MESEPAFLSLRLQSYVFFLQSDFVWLCFNGIVAGHRSIDLPPVDDDLLLLKTFQYLYMSSGVRNQPKNTRLSDHASLISSNVANERSFHPLFSAASLGSGQGFQLDFVPRNRGNVCFFGLRMEDKTSEMNMRYLNLKFLSEHFLWDESNHHKKKKNKHLAEKTIPTISINWSTSGLWLELGWEIEDWSTCQIKGVQAAGFLLPLGAPWMFSRFPVVQGSR